MNTCHRPSHRWLRAAMPAAAVTLVLTSTGCTGNARPDVAAPPIAEITMTDHAYEIPEGIRPGETLRVRNSGEELHMMLLGRLIGEATLDDVVAAMSAGDDSRVDTLLEQVGAPANYLAPGREVEISTSALTGGDYVTICFFGTEGNGTPHAFNGMAASFTVAGPPADSPSADSEFTVRSGKPIEGPTALDPGHETLGITADTDATALSITLWKVGAGQTLADVRTHVNELADAEVPVHGTGHEIAKHLVAAVYPPGEPGRLLLGVDLEPGSYILAAVDLYEDDGFDDTVEQIRITVG